MMYSTQSSRLRLAVLGCLLAVSAALLPCQSRMAVSRVAAPRAAWALSMCDAGEAAAPEAAAPVEAAAEAAEGGEKKREKRAKAPKLPLEGLEVGAMVQGTVRSVQAYGAFVDIGYSTDGLLHVSEMSDSFVKDANDMFAIGDAVTVRVKSIDLEKKQVALSNKDPNAVAPERAPREGGGRGRAPADLSEYATADEKAFVTGTVRSIQSFGAFISLKPGVDGLLHISEIKEGGVSAVGDVLKEGQEVQVRITSFDDKRRIGLSMKPFVELTAEEKAEKASGRKPRRSGRGGGRDGADDDMPFKMEPADLATLTLEFEQDPGSIIGAAMAREQAIKAAKLAKTKYPVLVL